MREGGFFLVVYSVYVYPLHVEYSWTFFQQAGADPEFRKKFRYAISKNQQSNH